MATKEYKKDDLTVLWDSSLCIHSEKCFHGLNSVFDAKARPWINVDGAGAAEIMKQIDQCPSGALNYKNHNNKEEVSMSEQTTKIEPMLNGPLMVYGDLMLKTVDGEEKLDRKAIAFCRCGHSENKPYCDGQHKAKDFKG